MKSIDGIICCFFLILLGFPISISAQADVKFITPDSIIIRVPTEDFRYPLEILLTTVGESSLKGALAEENADRIDLYLSLVLKEKTQFLKIKRVVKTWSGGKKKTKTKKFIQKYSLNLLSEVSPIHGFQPLPNRYPVVIWLPVKSLLFRE